MSPSASGCLLKALLQVAAILAITVTCTHGCRNFQTPPSVDASFGRALFAEVAGYKLLLTSDPPRNEGCYLFKFKDNITFSLEYKDNNYDPQMREGQYEFVPRTLSGPGYINLGLPPSTLGAGLFGGSRLYILYTAPDLSYFVTFSCGFLTNHVHVFGRTATVSEATTINATLTSAKIPSVEKFRAVDQACIKPPAAIRYLLPQYSISLPPSPSSPLPNHPFTSHNSVPVQFVTNPITGNPVSAAGT